MWKIVCPPAFLLVVPFATTIAQEQTPFEPGARVRVTAPALGMDKQAATLESLRGDTLRVVADSTMTCPLASVTRIDVYGGQKGHLVPGLLAGAAVGGVVALAIISGEAECRDSGDNAGLCRFFVATSVAAGGTLGALIGAFVWKTDKWEEVPLDQLRISVVPQRGGFALAVSVAF